MTKLKGKQQTKERIRKAYYPYDMLWYGFIRGKLRPPIKKIGPEPIIHEWQDTS